MYKKTAEKISLKNSRSLLFQVFNLQKHIFFFVKDIFVLMKGQPTNFISYSSWKSPEIPKNFEIKVNFLTNHKILFNLPNSRDDLLCDTLGSISPRPMLWPFWKIFDHTFYRCSQDHKLSSPLLSLGAFWTYRSLLLNWVWKKG